MKLKEKHSKLKRLVYQTLTMQTYLLSKELTKEEKIIVLRWRCRMETFGENYRGRREEVLCPLCSNHEDSEDASVNICETIKDKLNFKGDYKTIYEESIDFDASKSIGRVTGIRKRLLSG